VIGQSSPAGEAHLGIQATALSLRDCGIVLAVSSKNEDVIARLSFREHPHMLSREDHIAVFQANWKHKTSNLKAIAETLSLGMIRWCCSTRIRNWYGVRGPSSSG
jgi:predicted enzyme involved in methoxymalonyl-ACP biosynthesis